MGINRTEKTIRLIHVIWISIGHNYQTNSCNIGIYRTDNYQANSCSMGINGTDYYQTNSCNIGINGTATTRLIHVIWVSMGHRQLSY